MPIRSFIATAEVLDSASVSLEKSRLILRRRGNKRAVSIVA